MTGVFVEVTRAPLRRQQCLRVMVCVFAIAGFLSAPARADDPPDVLIDRGAVDQLEQLVGKTREPEKLGWLAEAALNRARAEQAAGESSHWAAVESRFQAWLDAIDHRRYSDKVLSDATRAAARIRFAYVLLLEISAADLDCWQLYENRQPPPEALRPRLTRVTKLLREAVRQLTPHHRQLAAPRPDLEDALLSLGVFDTLTDGMRDARHYLGWAELYLARVIGDSDLEQRLALLQDAAEQFDVVLNLVGDGPIRYRGLLGRAIVAGLLGDAPTADARFHESVQFIPDRERDGPQWRYERARDFLRRRQYEEARTLLEPLVAQSSDALAAMQPSARFYTNLGQLWHAYSYLLGAEALPQGPARDKLHKTALYSLARLAGRGNAWRELVRAYVSPHLDAPLTAESAGRAPPLELFFRGQRALEVGDFAAARELLFAAAERISLDDPIAGELALSLAETQRALNDDAAAFETLCEYAARGPRYPRATDAAGEALQIALTSAGDDASNADFDRLARIAAILLDKHPELAARVEAVWWRGAALERQGEFSGAAAAYARVEPAAEHFDEARFRHVRCLVRALDHRKADAPADAAPKLDDVIAALNDYLRETAQDAQSATGAAYQQLAWTRVQLAALELRREPPDARAAFAAISWLKDSSLDAALRRQVIAIRTRAAHALGDTGEYEKSFAALRTDLAEHADLPLDASTMVALLTAMPDWLESARAAYEGGDAERGRHAAKLVYDVADAVLQQIDQSGANATVEVVRLWRWEAALLAGDEAAARQATDALGDRLRQSVEFRARLARVLTLIVKGERVDEAAIKGAEQAWADLLQDLRGARGKSPAYWEARINQLELLARRGETESVRTAIEQERIWFPDLGGARFRDRFEALERAVTHDP